VKNAWGGTREGVGKPENQKPPFQRNEKKGLWEGTVNFGQCTRGEMVYLKFGGDGEKGQLVWTQE